MRTKLLLPPKRAAAAAATTTAAGVAAAAAAETKAAATSRETQTPDFSPKQQQEQQQEQQEQEQQQQHQQHQLGVPVFCCQRCGQNKISAAAAAADLLPLPGVSLSRLFVAVLLLQKAFRSALVRNKWKAKP